MNLVEKKNIECQYRAIQELKKLGIDKFREHLRTVMARVAFVFEQHPETRSDDNLLLINYWHSFTQIRLKQLDNGFFALIAPDLESFSSVATLETVSRCGRKWREYGFYLGSIEKTAQRQAAYEEFKRTLPRLVIE